MSAPTNSPAPVRAAVAAGSVITLFGHRLLHLPGTHLAAIRWPRPRASDLRGPWHYWWQAHYLDCLVDAGWREHGAGLPVVSLRLGQQLLRGIRVRNLFRYPNHYYDDMGWLVLAAGRLDALSRAVTGAGGRGCRNAVAALGPRLIGASTDDAGGGLFWNTQRTFKNTPATAPAALFFARAGEPARTRALTDWLRENLLDADSGLYLDGLRLGGATIETVRDRYTYNQGPVLGALLALGEPADLDAAARLVRAVDTGLTRASPAGARVLVTHGDGDGGLFTGILTRYLAAAATDARLDPAARATAGRLVTDTAEALWAGRRRVEPAESPAPRSGGPDAGALIFSADPGVEAVTSYPPGAPVELSTQLQAWMAFEAAAVCAGGTPADGRGSVGVSGT
ncbi:glycoside hydrolase [Tersicoccus solisilvae]|uniref:Glycoside hydrolase n=1 Tax=Tersicoccus solisilvae TaxID=1882339 RepID=A0ABQ1P3Y6_9MICC|nr:glycoside hydrolase family 76 protein [Tersicoccus solisilvae]GGC90283.1 glycoside hydrolase [Tersicoccus solisilvae]